MTVLVAAASEHGATAEIADRIGAYLARHGVDVEVSKLEDVTSLGGYDAFVVGSAVYMGQWLKGARTFVEHHANEFAERPTWLFSSGPIGAEPDPKEAARPGLVEATHAREHRVFGGKLDKSKLNWCEKVAVRAVHAQEGDYRDWEAIDDWAAAIARELHREHAGTPA